ncbi:restriction endonuclease subunit S [Shewanella morhuae]|uniref:Restriction enzyme BgcI subunit beta n=1 Tax=Shewanella morhuae TaxID=365591 RepID=A0A380AV69_9GAMM|nr:restriction endonuclease subunit S [Shewanella morhuae]SUI87901.1 Restriction enzyme BgcI subunit beta [Shewanella morhuae]
MVELQEIFNVKYGVNLELNKLTQSKDGINFVSRTVKNNGVSAVVELVEGKEPIEAGVITVSGGGSVLEAFLQPEPFYSGRDLYYLEPKFKLTTAQKLYYCVCIRANKYKYSYGRQANRTLKHLKVPHFDDFPKWVNNADLSIYEGVDKPKINNSKPLLPSFKDTVKVEEIFEVVNGIAATGLKEKDKAFENSVMYIRPAATQARTLRSYIAKFSVPEDKIFPQGSLFVSTNGEGSHSYSYVSTDEFVPNSDVSVLIPKGEISIEEKLFYAKCITANRYLFSYGRKPKGNKLKSIKIPKLEGKDIEKVISYINSLPYSSNI